MEPRNCQFIILKMLEKIPTEKKEFIKDLNWNLQDAAYKAPEDTIQWERTMRTLMKHIPNPVEEWEFEVLSIFTTKSVFELKAEFKALRNK